MPDINNTIYREMVLDLIYRLRLADELFCRVTDMVMSAMSMDDADGRQQAVEQLHAYAQSIQVIHADFQHVLDGHHVAFPADIQLWQWYESNGDEIVARTLERLHAIAEGMELKLNTAMLKMEAGR